MDATVLAKSILPKNDVQKLLRIDTNLSEHDHFII